MLAVLSLDPTLLSFLMVTLTLRLVPRSRDFDNLIVIVDTILRRQYLTLCCFNVPSVAENRSDKRSEI